MFFNLNMESDSEGDEEYECGNMRSSSSTMVIGADRSSSSTTILEKQFVSQGASRPMTFGSKSEPMELQVVASSSPAMLAMPEFEDGDVMPLPFATLDHLTLRSEISREEMLLRVHAYFQELRKERTLDCRLVSSGSVIVYLYGTETNSELVVSVFPDYDSGCAVECSLREGDVLMFDDCFGALKKHLIAHAGVQQGFSVDVFADCDDEFDFKFQDEIDEITQEDAPEECSREEVMRLVEALCDPRTSGEWLRGASGRLVALTACEQDGEKSSASKWIASRKGVEEALLSRAEGCWDRLVARNVLVLLTRLLSSQKEECVSEQFGQRLSELESLWEKTSEEVADSARACLSVV